MRAIVITRKTPKNINDLINIKKDDFVIVVDGAFDEVIKQKIKIDLVVGDFDSVKNIKRLKQYDLLKLNPEKDITDTNKALEKAYKISNDVILIGGIKGKRIEHFIGNIQLFNKHDNLLIIDEDSKIYLLKKGKHIIKKGNFINMFAYPKATLTLKDFKYNISNYKLDLFDPLIISNELNSTLGEVEIIEGKVLVIETKKD